MARNERLIHASPAAVFGVLSDPRSYAYWVIGSREIRAADPHWPQPGSHFDHTVNVGPLRVQDHTLVEAVEADRRLQLKARARPLGTARITLTLEPTGDGTLLQIVEDPGDALSAVLFGPLTHRLVRRRNEHSLERLAELAEGRVPIPGEEPEARVRTPGAGGPVVNPRLHGRPAARRRAFVAIGCGALAGLAGAATMSLSTNAEMRLRGRAPSDVPARAVERLLGVRIRGKRRRMGAAAAGHLVTSVGLGAARGAMDVAGLSGVPAGAATLGLALVPELVAVPALGAAPPPWRWSAAETAISVLHHGVYAGTVALAYARLRRPGRVPWR